MAEAGTIFPDIDPNTTSGTQLATLLNEFKDAVVGGFFTDTGTRPTNLAAKGYWIDAQNDPIWSYKIYNGTADQEIFQLDTSTGNVTLGSTASPLDVSKVSDDSIGALVNLVKGRTTGNQAQDGDTIGELNFVGVTDTSSEEIMTQIKTVATDDVTAAAHGADMSFSTTPDGGSTLTERMRIKEDGKVGVGTNAPDVRLHASGSSSTGGIKSTVAEDSASGGTVTANKKRIAGSGQTQTSDVLGNFDISGTDENGDEVVVAKIKATASENSQSTQHGSTVAIQTVKTGETALGDRVNIDGAGDVSIPGNFTVTGNFTVNGTQSNHNVDDMDIEDKNITLNKGGDDASSEGAGFTVERTGTDGSVVYEDALASKFKIGALGSEAEVVTTSNTQTITNKTVTGADIRTPTRSDVKQDTEANLTTYAGSASNGQMCFATDTKKYYTVIDSVLVFAGDASGAASLTGTQTFANKSFSDSTTHDEIATPATPASNKWRLYFKTDGLYQLDDAGVETNVSTGGGSVIGSWTAGGALTIGGANTNPTKGTTVVDQSIYQLLSDNTLLVVMEYEQSAAGSGGSGDYFITIPGGYTVDTAKLGRTTFANNDTRTPVFGSCKVANTSAEGATGGLGSVGLWSSTQVRLIIHEGNTQRFWASDKLGLAGSVIHAYAWFCVPVV